MDTAFKYFRFWIKFKDGTDITTEPIAFPSYLEANAHGLILFKDPAVLSVEVQQNKWRKCKKYVRVQ